MDSQCKGGANMNYWYDNGDCPLWQDLETGQEDIASTLVKYTKLSCMSDVSLWLCTLSV